MNIARMFSRDYARCPLTTGFAAALPSSIPLVAGGQARGSDRIDTFVRSELRRQYAFADWRVPDLPNDMMQDALPVSWD